MKIPQVYLSFIVNHTCSYSIYQLEMCAVSNLARGCDILIYDYITPVLLTLQTATNKDEYNLNCVRVRSSV